MEPGEIRKWKRSTLQALESSQGEEAATRATICASAALWEIAQQLAVANERELTLAPRFRALREVLGTMMSVARQNQALLRQLLRSSNSRRSSGGGRSSKRTSRSSSTSGG